MAEGEGCGAVGVRSGCRSRNTADRVADTADVRFSWSWRREVQGQGAPAGSASGDDPLPAPQMPSSHRVGGLSDGGTRAVHDVTSHGPPHSLSERTKDDEFVIGTEPSSVL